MLEQGNWKEACLIAISSQTPITSWSYENEPKSEEAIRSQMDPWLKAINKEEAKVNKAETKLKGNIQATTREISPLLVHEIQHLIQSREGFATGSSIERSGSYEAYEKVMGEAEARNASRRMDLSDEERRSSLLESTEDVARGDQIFIQDNLMNSVSKKTSFVPKYTEEEESIISQAIADGTYMTAPNGEESKLTPKQWAQVRTKAFKK